MQQSRNLLRQVICMFAQLRKTAWVNKALKVGFKIWKKGLLYAPWQPQRLWCLQVNHLHKKSEIIVNFLHFSCYWKRTRWLFHNTFLLFLRNKNIIFILVYFCVFWESSFEVIYWAPYCIKTRKNNEVGCSPSATIS